MLPNKIFVNPFALSKRICRPLILDGAMGSMLQQSGLKIEGSLWMSMANITDPDKVYKIHRKYIEAGADIITTNTFRTNPAAIKGYKHKLNHNKLVKAGVKIALEAASGYPVYIVGSNAPAEDCYQEKRTLTYKELVINHHYHIDLLMDSGCHFILNETQSHLDEIKIICKYCNKNDIPYILSIFVNDNLHLLSGEKIFDVIPVIIDYAPLAIGINCIRQNTFRKIYKRLNTNLIWGAYLNCGNGKFKDENIVCGVSPVDYKNEIKKILPKKPSFIGACCGSTPEHIKKIKKLLDGKVES